ncbi:DUF4446 family protein [Anaerococcus sp. DFU013_CI05]|uniref:DUF4446 family protein n=1 Tax=unclassified Anaerococcus TaxID=2614126 RepID=UPI00193344D1|nr:DUF4446 family protein [Anaerococcus sp. mt242]MBM0046230.1 DUF4446 family protein [Anaerococcus sp. mt242]
MTVVYVLLGILAILVVVEFAMIQSMNNRIRRQKHRYDHLLRGTSEEVNLEELLLKLNDQIETSNQQLKSVDQRSLEAKDTTMGAISNMSVVHFNAFDGDTNELSFCLCMLDNFHNGIILTSIYGKDGSTIYLKEISNGQTRGEISQQEDAALQKARN